MFSHAFNPFPAKDGSEHELAQRVTYASIRRAQKEARAKGIQVELVPLVLRGEEAAVPGDFPEPRLIHDCLRDLPSFGDAPPYPLFGSLLKAVQDGPLQEFVVYTNVDIALQPHFYKAVADLLKMHSGRALAINRRTISAAYSGPEELEQMYKEEGEGHPGYDCFVIPSDWLAKVKCGKMCIGAPYFDTCLVGQLSFLGGITVLKGEHLTFHLGNDETWRGRKKISTHNTREALKILSKQSQQSAARQAGREFWFQLDQARERTFFHRRIRRRTRFMPGFKQFFQVWDRVYRPSPPFP